MRTTSTALLGVTGLLGAVVTAMMWRQLGSVLGWEIEIASALFMLLAAIVWLPIALETAGFTLRAPLIRMYRRLPQAISTPFHVAGYSLTDQARLGEMYADVSHLLSTSGADGTKDALWGRLSTLMETWNDQRQRQHEMDTGKLLELWRAAYDTSIEFHTALYGQNGIVKNAVYQNYKGELAEVLKDSATMSAQVTDHTYLHQLQSGLNGFGVILQALSRAKPLHDPHLSELIIAAAARADINFANTAYTFQDWLSQANRRAQVAKAALQQ